MFCHEGGRAASRGERKHREWNSRQKKIGRPWIPRTRWKRNTFSKFLEKYFQQLIIAGRPPKRLKGVKLARRSFRPSNSSSFDPSSPASSDVDVDVDYKSFLDDESDVDSLSALPSSEDNFLSPR